MMALVSDPECLATIEKVRGDQRADKEFPFLPVSLMEPPSEESRKIRSVSLATTP